MDLFVYGTLMVPEVMRAVCRHDGPGQRAQLHGYRRRLLAGELYPAIVPDEGESVDGLLYRHLSGDQFAALDAFEGDQYCRAQVEVIVAGGGRLAAAAYVLAPAHGRRMTDRPWSLESFRADGLAAFLAQYRGFAALVGGERPDDRV